MSLLEFFRRRVLVRRVLILGAHLVLYALAFLGAFLVRFDFTLPHDQEQNFLLGLLLIVLLRTFSGLVFRIYGGVMKYAGIKDLIDILKSMSVATAAFVVALVLFRFQGFPRSIILIDWVVAIGLVGGMRFGLRVLREALVAPGPEDSQRKRVMILGGDAGEALVRDLLRSYRDRYEVVGFLDDNKTKHGLRIHDVPVLGPILYLGDYAPRFRVDEVIIAIPTASSKTMRAIFEILKIAGVRFKTLPGVDQLLDGNVSAQQIRDVAIEDLLGREQVDLEEGLLRKFLHQKVVMVTGAGGSIGSEMCRQILRYHPRMLLLVDQSEPSLFFIHSELKGHKGLELPIVPVIADVTDRERMKRIFLAYAPEVIFHAAAHKHVPMMEWNPGEAIKNNVFGTKNMADLALSFGALAFVMISTDKAVNPTSVMGATKRVSEMYVQALSKERRTKFVAVRFGNVLGSVGSVVPIFKDQIARGGPVTVTHPDMRRYFMTIPESCQLVMQSAAMGEGGEIFVLDMGEPVKIVDLARDLINLSGFKAGEDIDIVFTGLRPGEKLFEELGFDAEKMEKTRHPKVYTGKLTPYPMADVALRLAALRKVIDETDPSTIKHVLKAVVPEYEPGDITAPPSGDHEAVATPEPVDLAPAVEARMSVIEALTPRGEALTPKDSIAAISPSPKLGGGEKGALDNEGVRACAPAPTLPPRENHNPILDPAWERFVALCQDAGFTAVGWNTMGIRPADVREVHFNGEAGERRSVIKRSVSITTLSFIDMKFIYTDRAGKETPDWVKKAVMTISSEMVKHLLAIRDELAR